MSGKQRCAGCLTPFVPGGASVMVGTSVVEVFLDHHCIECMVKRIVQLGTVCENCSEPIPPNSSISAVPKGGGGYLIFHSTFECSPPGGAYYGYWGEGELLSVYNRVEQC